MVNNREDFKTIKDLSEEFNSSVAKLLEEIDFIKKALHEDKYLIKKLDERLHALSIKIYPKMTSDENKKQISYRNHIRKIRWFKTKAFPAQGEVEYKPVLSRRGWFKFKDMLESREKHLNVILERVGLTATDMKIKRRLN